MTLMLEPMLWCSQRLVGGQLRSRLLPAATQSPGSRVQRSVLGKTRDRGHILVLAPSAARHSALQLPPGHKYRHQQQKSVETTLPEFQRAAPLKAYRLCSTFLLQSLSSGLLLLLCWTLCCQFARLLLLWRHSACNTNYWSKTLFKRWIKINSVSQCVLFQDLSRETTLS